MEALQKRYAMEQKVKDQVKTIQSLKFIIEKTCIKNTPDSNKRMLEAVQRFRNMLASEKPPTKHIIEAGAIPLFAKLLEREDLEIVQFEAAWALTNVASDGYAEEVVKCGAVPHLTRLLLSGDPKVREQSAWCLGNIAGESAELRDVALAAGALKPL